MKEIVSHTSLRGIAALLASMYHLQYSLDQSVALTHVTQLVSKSYALVDLFFLLSGFVMALVYARFMRNAPSREDLHRFFVARFARIYPLHFATLSFMVLLSTTAAAHFGGPGPDLAHLLKNALLIQAWGLNDHFELNFPSWSVSAEFAAYLLFPLFANLFRRGVPRGAFAMLLTAHYLTLSLLFDNLQLGERLLLLRGVPGFLLGMLLCQYRDAFAGFSHRTLTAIQLPVALATVGIMHLGLNDYLLIPLFGLLILSTFRDEGLVARLLGARFLQALGHWSYGIYLLHIPVRNVGHYVWPKLPFPLDPALSSVLFCSASLTATVVTAALVHRAFERPMRDLLRQRLAPAARPPAIPPATTGV